MVASKQARKNAASESRSGLPLFRSEALLGALVSVGVEYCGSNEFLPLVITGLTDCWSLQEVPRGLAVEQELGAPDPRMLS